MKTVQFKAKIKAGKNVVEQTHLLKSFFLNDHVLDRIGEQHECITCGKKFFIGEAELQAATRDTMGKPKRNIDPFLTSDIQIDVNLALNPIDHDKYTLSDLAIIYGVEYVNRSMCPACTDETAGYNAAIGGVNAGQEVQRGAQED